MTQCTPLTKVQYKEHWTGRQKAQVDNLFAYQSPCPQANHFITLDIDILSCKIINGMEDGLQSLNVP